MNKNSQTESKSAGMGIHMVQSNSNILRGCSEPCNDNTITAKKITPFDDSYFIESGLKDTSLLLEIDD